jgi:YHS domain-containing protein
MKTILALSFAVLLAGAGCSNKSDRDDSNRAYSGTEARVKDPVCGMMCDKATARKVEHNGKTQYFCSEECATKFRSNPDSFVSR